MTPLPIAPADAQALLASGARLVDIRSADEHARTRIAGAQNVPLDRIETLAPAATPVIFHCRSGMRTGVHGERLAAAAQGAPAYAMTGGIDAWRADGHAVVTDRSQPLEIMRQVQIAAGFLVLIGVVAALKASPAFIALPAFVGAGLLFAGVTGWCGMAHLLARMPWNRRAV